MASNKYYYYHLHLCVNILKVKLKGIHKIDIATFIIKQQQLFSAI